MPWPPPQYWRTPYAVMAESETETKTQFDYNMSVGRHGSVAVPHQRRETVQFSLSNFITINRRIGHPSARRIEYTKSCVAHSTQFVFYF